MLSRHGSKFCVDWRYQCSDIFDLRSTSLGKPGHIILWPDCQPEFPGNGGDRLGGDGGVPTTLPSGQTPVLLCAGIKHPVHKSLTSTWPVWHSIMHITHVFMFDTLFAGVSANTAPNYTHCSKDRRNTAADLGISLRGFSKPCPSI